jgi:diguanylate cyclase (GGDEF)-like protein
VSQHVVIVDDDDLTLKLFTSIAGQISGVVVHPFLSSTEAIDWYHGKTVDCFVFDYNMPVLNGLQMIALVRALPEFALVPIVIVTGAHEREVRYKALDAGANDFLQKPVDYREMLARMTTLLALREAQKKLAQQVGSLEASLLDAEERSREHAERLEALWNLANNPDLHDEELMLAILKNGAAAIRPGQAYRAMLARVEDQQMRVISGGEAAGYTDNLGPIASRVGQSIPLGETIVGGVLADGGGTRSWDDLTKSAEITPNARAHGWRAMMTTTFIAGGSTYVLSFASNESATKPFGPQDHAYIEVLASFFSAYYQQHWQSARLGHQLEHDSLTGLWNRSRFRSLGRAAFHAGAGAAIAVVNLAGFHDVNERHGHMTGDAILVEVAAAFAGTAHENEIVARTGGNTFAIFFPDVPSRESLLESVARFGSVFDAAMGIGDREGKESVRVSGRIGFAQAPHDGNTIDELLLRAEGRARADAVHADRRSFP